MPSPIKVPALGESITEAIIANWLQPVGARVEIDQPLVELETDKVTVEVPSPVAGIIVRQAAEKGATVRVGDIIGEVDSGDAARPAPSASSVAASQPASSASPVPLAAVPSARAEALRSGVDLGEVQGTGRGGRILKEDVQRAAQPAPTQPAAAPRPAAAPAAKPTPAPARAPAPVRAPGSDGPEEVVAMSPLRRRVAERLIQAQSSAAILTTFNEVDMSAIYKLRATYKQTFVDKHGVKLGFMSFFVKAAVSALKAFPAVNAEIRGDDIVYKHFYDIGVAVGGGKGLVVPVIRGADALGFADVEKEIGRLGARARDNKLTLEELSGGTFTISNGGVYGSMLSTPILNPPQTGILGLHNVVDRPVAVNGQVEIRPVMYLALSYDHRLVDGREAVQFLVHIKERIEAPERLLLEV
jgi:2-oxoglutarate dehydrogenase E2 component (dihydrolipoamide succinyltransferase)